MARCGIENGTLVIFGYLDLVCLKYLNNYPKLNLRNETGKNFQKGFLQFFPCKSLQT